MCFADNAVRRFLSNGGAVAGVFAVIGLIVAAVAAIIAFILCKRRRRRRIRQSISRPLPYPDNPFEDPRQSPIPAQMRYANTEATHRNLVGAGLGLERGQRNLLDDEFDPPQGSLNRSHPPSIHSRHSSRHGSEIIQTLAGIGSGVKSVGKPPFDSSAVYNGPFAEYHTFQPSHQQRPSNGSSIGVAITNDKVQERSLPTPRHIKRVSVTPSAAPSTPSIYPATLPGGEEDVNTESSHGPMTPSTTEQASSLFDVKPPPAIPVRPPRKRPVNPLPPRNPQRLADQSKLLIRTQLTQEDVNILEEKKPYEPLTPPSSVSSDGGYSPLRNSANPFADYNNHMSMVQPPVDAKPRDTFFTRRKVVSPHVSLLPCMHIFRGFTCSHGRFASRAWNGNTNVMIYILPLPRTVAL